MNKTYRRVWDGMGEDLENGSQVMPSVRYSGFRWPAFALLSKNKESGLDRAIFQSLSWLIWGFCVDSDWRNGRERLLPLPVHTSNGKY